MSTVAERTELVVEDEDIKTLLVAEVVKYEKEKDKATKAENAKKTASKSIIEKILEAQAATEDEDSEAEYTSVRIELQEFVQKKDGFYDKVINIVRPKASSILNLEKLKEVIGAKRLKSCMAQRITIDVSDPEATAAILKYLDRHREAIVQQEVTPEALSMVKLEALQKTGAVGQDVIKDCTDVEHGGWKINGAMTLRHESKRIAEQAKQQEDESLQTIIL